MTRKTRTLPEPYETLTFEARTRALRTIFNLSPEVAAQEAVYDMREIGDVLSTIELTFMFPGLPAVVMTYRNAAHTANDLLKHPHRYPGAIADTWKGIASRDRSRYLGGYT